MKQLIYINKLDIASELIFPLSVFVVMFIAFFRVYMINKEENKKTKKLRYIVIFTSMMFLLNFSYIFYKNSKIHSALTNTSKNHLIQGKVKNYRYINGKHFADFKIKDMRFHHAEIGYKVLEDKLDATIKVEYITIFKEPIIIRMWEVRE